MVVKKVMTESDLVAACKNIGFDLTCGACAALFYTNVPLEKNTGVCFQEHDSTCSTHTCPSGGRTETQRADGAEAALSLASDRAIRAEAQCKQLLTAIQSATVGDLTDSDRVSKYRACLLCRRDLNVCERDYRVAVETNALDRACKGAKVRALITSPENVLERSPVSHYVAEVHKYIGKEVPPFEQSTTKLPPGACPDCGGECQVVQRHGPDDNYDTVECPTCFGTGLQYPSIRIRVIQFHEAFLPEQGVGDGPPHVPTDDLVRLRVKLPFEEAFELLRASFDARKDADELWAHVQRLIRTARIRVNLPEVADALADLAYVVEGANLAYGIDSRAVLAEVHRSNLTKIGGHRRADGKWEKPPTYSKADVAGVLKKLGWQP